MLIILPKVKKVRLVLIIQQRAIKGKKVLLVVEEMDLLMLLIMVLMQVKLMAQMLLQSIMQLLH